MGSAPIRIYPLKSSQKLWSTRTTSWKILLWKPTYFFFLYPCTVVFWIGLIFATRSTFYGLWVLKNKNKKKPLSSVNKLIALSYLQKKILEPALFCNFALTKLKTKINVLDFWVLVPEIDPWRKMKNKFGPILRVVFFFIFKTLPVSSTRKNPQRVGALVMGTE